MKLSSTVALKLWHKYYGDASWAEDFDGGIMYRDAYGNPNAYYLNEDGKKIYCGWNLHHILAVTKGGSNDVKNLICTNIITNEQAGDKTTYTLDNGTYQVRKIKGIPNAYEIVQIS